MKLNAKELRDVEEIDMQAHLSTIKRKPLYLILENVYDTYNIGGLFRLADALCVSKMYLCGTMEIPPNSKIKKASIGTYKVVPWEYKNAAKEAIEEVRALYPTDNSDKKSGVRILAVEQDKRSIKYTKADYTYPLALLVGNETYGVLPETLDLVDQIVEIPMWGINKSLNVIVSAAIVAYRAVGEKGKR
jgi:23S rRNA (guanosine2251-2'-O)-methyltransferase